MKIKDNLNFKGIEIDFAPPKGIENFYGENIKGVCCIIGKNGSGKSNILEQIGKQILKENFNVSDIEQTSVIYYAPIINNRQFDGGLSKNFIDISEKYNFDTYQNMLSIKNINSGNDQKLDNVIKKDVDYSPLILWTLKYLSNKKEQKHQSELLNQFDIETTIKDEYSYFITDYLDKSLKNKIAKYQGFLNDLIPKFEPQNEINPLYDSLLLFKSIDSFFITDFFSIGLSETRKFILYLLFETNKFISESQDLYNLFLSEFFELMIKTKENSSFESMNNFVNKFIEKELQNGLLFYPDIMNLKKSFDSKGIQKVNEVGEDKNGVLIELLEYINKFFGSVESVPISIKVKSKENSIFNFSSGDTAYYTFLGRVILAIKDQFNLGNTKILLLLDEVDIALHPARQKALFKTIIDSINEICTTYQGKQKIEIKLVLTTHSPFLASDIPKENIVYLKVDEVINDKGEREVVTTQNKDIENSFAANIHMLYKNSFYLENGLIGDFAVEKIEKKIIPYLTGKSKKIVNTKLLMDHIKLVGDPILYEKMLLQYFEIYGNEDSYKAEIRKLIESLENKLKL